MFDGALKNLNKDLLIAVLPSYGIDKKEDISKMEAAFDGLLKDKFPYRTIPEIIEKELHILKDDTVKNVKKELSRVGPCTDFEFVTLYRGDNRGAEEIKAAGGFWGRDDAVLSLEHARFHIKEIANSGWVYDWKLETKGKTERVPYVATGTDSQKAGYVYKIQLPLNNIKPSMINPIIVTDTGDVETASIIALLMRGPEILFLTGIPLNFIKSCNGIPL